MEIMKIFESNSFKVMNVTLKKGESMPNHIATSDALVIVKGGKAELRFDDREIELQNDSIQLIEANERHNLTVTEDFGACIILLAEGKIEFVQ